MNKNMTRNVISIRLSAEEKAAVQEKADKAGLPISTYCREKSLGSQVQDNLPRQKIARTLCALRNDIEDAEIIENDRKKLNERIDKIWQYIK